MVEKNPLSPPPLWGVSIKSPGIADPPRNYLLEALGGKPFGYESKWFNNQELQIDGYAFKNCRFDNCTLITSKGTFQFDHCVIEGCTFLFGTEARRVVQLHNVGLFNANDDPNLMVVQEGDGTVSIS